MMRRHLVLILTMGGVAELCASEPAPSGASPDTGHPPAAPALAAQFPGGAAVDPALLRTYRSRVEAELRNDILPFWLSHTRDRQRGGFYGEIRNDLAVRENAPRGALLTSRILWTFSAAYRHYQDPAYLEMARWAYDDLLARFWDNEQGGLFWSVTAYGKPLDTRKLIYGQAFGIYALAEYHRATGDRAPLDQAIALYRAVETHSRDREYRGYFEDFTR